MVRRLVYWISFGMMIIWTGICSFFSMSLLPFLMRFLQLASGGHNDVAVAASGIANLTFVALLVGMWFFPVVGLGMIALVAKPENLSAKPQEPVSSS